MESAEEAGVEAVAVLCAVATGAEDEEADVVEE